MQAIILMAGKNSRFFPLETIGHKAMMQIYGKPIVEYLIDDLKDVGIEEVIIVAGRDIHQIKDYFGNGSKFKTIIKYVHQKEAKGQGNALLCAKDLINGPFLVTNPYHLGEKDIFQKSIDLFNDQSISGVLPAIYEENINDYGALILEKERIMGVIEKPETGKEPSNYRVTSAYLFDREFIEYLEKENEEEYSYEKAYTKFCNDKKVIINEIQESRYIPSLKYPWHLFEIQEFISESKQGFIHDSVVIAENVVIEDTVYIDQGVKIFEGACIKGKTYIGRNSIIGNNSVVRDSNIGENVSVGVNSDIARSIIMSGSSSHGGGFIGDSIIGPDNKLAAGFTTANKRADRENIICEVKEKKISIGSNSLGIVTGKNCKFGINTSSMPGKFVGEESITSPSAIIFENLKHKSILKYIQKQQILSNEQN